MDRQKSQVIQQETYPMEGQETRRTQQRLANLFLTLVTEPKDTFSLEGEAYDQAHEVWNQNRSQSFLTTIREEDTLEYWYQQILEKIRHYTKDELQNFYKTLPYPNPSCLQIAHDCNPVQHWHDI